MGRSKIRDKEVAPSSALLRHEKRRDTLWFMTAAPTRKRCGTCGKLKPLDAYYRRTDSKALKSDCKTCYNAKLKASYEKNKAKKLAKCAEYRKQHKKQIAEYHRGWNKRNKEHVAKRSAEYRRRPEVRERIKAQQHDWYAEHATAIQAKRKARLEANPEIKKRQREYELRYARLNKDIWNAKTNRRRVKRVSATPKWANSKAIRGFYAKAARLTAQTGIKHVVDHVVPLQGKNVCGLHVENNLRVVTEKVNLEKFNKFKD
jgi:hypothetical protein